jgi:hypothetical protein
VSASLERQVTKAITLTATYSHSLGVHQIATRDSNAYLPGTFEYGSTTLTGTRPNGAGTGIVDEIYPEAVFKENQLTTNIRATINSKLNVTGFYNVTFANANTGKASNSYNLSQDYGRASFASRNMLFLMGGYTGPWGITFNPFVILQSGRPYDIATPFDLTGDNFMNDRPAYATSAQCQSSANTGEFVTTSFGCFDVTPNLNPLTNSGVKLIPVNMANGPGSKTVNLRVSRSFAIGPKIVTEAANQDNGPQGGPGGGPSGAPGGGGGMRGGGGGGGMGGGPGGGPGGGMGGGMGGPGGGPGGMSSTTGAKRKYSLTFSAQASNLFNDINLSNPNGVVTPTPIAGTTEFGPGAQFGTSNSLSGGGGPGGPGGGGGSSSASRIIRFQAAFSF